MTESPRRNSFGMKRSLFTGFEPFFPRPVFGICAHPAAFLSSVSAHISIFSETAQNGCKYVAGYSPLSTSP